MRIPSFKRILQCPIVKLTFDDHCMGATNALECECYGRLVYSDNKKYVIVTWLPRDKDVEVIESNWETFVILKRVVRKIAYLTDKNE